MGLKKFDYQINDNRMKKSYISLFVVIGVLIAGVVIYKSFAKFEVQDDFNVIAGKVHTPVVIQTGKVYDNNDDPTKPATYTLYDTGDLVVDFPEDCTDCLAVRENEDSYELGEYITAGVLYDYIMTSNIFTEEEKELIYEDPTYHDMEFTLATLDDYDLIKGKDRIYVLHGGSSSSLLNKIAKSNQENVHEAIVTNLDSDELYGSIYTKIRENFVKFNKVTVNFNDVNVINLKMFWTLDCNSLIINSGKQISNGSISYYFVGLSTNKFILSPGTVIDNLSFRYILSPNLNIEYPASSNNTLKKFERSTLKSVRLNDTMTVDFVNDFESSIVESVYVPSTITNITDWDGSDATTLYLDGPRSAYTITNPENFKGIVDCQKAELCES